MNKPSKTTSIISSLAILFLFSFFPIQLNAGCSIDCGATITKCKDGYDCSVDVDENGENPVLTCDGEKHNCDGPVKEFQKLG